MLKKLKKLPILQLHDFIFSSQRQHRFLRHLVFWTTWWLYFSTVYWYNQHVTGAFYDNFIKLGFHIPLKSFFLLIIQGIACYTFIYFLLPHFLLRSKWLKLTAGILFLSIVILIAGYLMHKWIFPFIDSLFGNPPANVNANILWTSVSTGLLNTPKVVAAAVAIKLLKYWWFRQKEKESLEREKIITELQLLKAQIHPSFLFNSLNKIYAYSLAASPRGPEMLLKLSDLLSYMLYECDQPLVPLDKETQMMKKYMSMEKIRFGDNFEMEILTIGEAGNKTIAPFLLLPFIENSFVHCAKMPEKPWITMDIRIEENTFSMKLINGISTDSYNQKDLFENGLASVQKRLNFLYPNRHELKMNAEEEMFLVYLKIELDEPIEELASTVHADDLISSDLY